MFAPTGWQSLMVDDQPLNTVAQASKDIGRAIAEAKADHTNSYLRLGAILRHVQESGLWEETHESFAHFVTEHGFSRSWAYQAIGVVERFGERAKNILPSRLQMLLPIKAGKEEEDDLLSKARDLPAEAFLNTVKEKRGHVTTDSCDHSELGSYCKGCGKHFS